MSDPHLTWVCRHCCQLLLYKACAGVVLGWRQAVGCNRLAIGFEVDARVEDDGHT